MLVEWYKMPDIRDDARRSLLRNRMASKLQLEHFFFHVIGIASLRLENIAHGYQADTILRNFKKYLELLR